MTIPFVDLKQQYLSIKNEIDAAMRGIIENTSFIMGKDIKELEKEFAASHNAEFAVGVSSGTSALFLALVGAGSVVTKDETDNKVVCGNPAKTVGEVDKLNCRYDLNHKPYKKNASY